MAKTNKFVHFNTRAAFDAHLAERGANPSAAEGNDLYYYTVYIKDTEEIYTHGKFYGDNAIYAQRADFATELTGRLEATSEAFTYRPSAGDKSVKDDNAFIRRVKGNSVVFNQIGNPLSANGGWYLNPEYGTVEYGDNYIKITSVSDSQAANGMGLTCVRPLAQAINGHAYLITVDMKPSKAMKCGFRNFADTWTGNTNDLIGGQWSNISYIVTCTSETTRYPCIGNSLGSQIVSGDTIEIKNLMIFDLTAMFGAGNEPTTVEEFRALYPNSYYPYNAGELRNLLCSGIKTVGFNQWDEQWEVGYISGYDGINGASTTCIRSANFIKCLPDTEYSATQPTYGIFIAFYDFSKQYIGYVSTQNLFTTPTNCAFIRFYVEYGTTVSTYNHDICINLHHTGYRDGEYEPYKEVTHALPLSKITNGEPLRKAGGEVYDEINETEYIRRVGVRGYATGDKDDATLLTDGRYTNYPLDEPIITPIETPIDFNYYVEDFGTEEAMLAENSAPFSADIVYQFNAVDRIRQNDLNIDRLEDKVLALPSEFKTINGNSIIGSGDLIITAGNVGTEDDDGGLDDVNTRTYLRYVEQSLTDEQKLQARINIGASSNIIIGNATQATTSLQHNVLLKWVENGTTESMSLEFPTNDGSTVLNCGFLLYLTPDATSDYSLYLDGIEIYWANNTTPELEPEYYYEMWFTSYDGGAAWFGVFTKYTM